MADLVQKIKNVFRPEDTLLDKTPTPVKTVKPYVSLSLPTTGWNYGQNNLLVGGFGTGQANPIYIPLNIEFTDSTGTTSVAAADQCTFTITSATGLSNYSGVQVTIMGSGDWGTTSGLWLPPTPLDAYGPTISTSGNDSPFLCFTFSNICEYFQDTNEYTAQPSFTNGTRTVSVEVEVSYTDYASDSTTQTYTAKNTFTFDLSFLVGGWITQSTGNTGTNGYSGIYPLLPGVSPGGTLSCTVPFYTTSKESSISITKGKEAPSWIDISYSNGKVTFSGTAPKTAMTAAATFPITISDGIHSYTQELAYIVIDDPQLSEGTYGGSNLTNDPDMAIQIASPWTSANGGNAVGLYGDTATVYIPITSFPSQYTGFAFSGATANGGNYQGINFPEGTTISYKYLSTQPTTNNGTCSNIWTGPGYYVIIDIKNGSQFWGVDSSGKSCAYAGYGCGVGALYFYAISPVTQNQWGAQTQTMLVSFNQVPKFNTPSPIDVTVGFPINQLLSCTNNCKSSWYINQTPGFPDGVSVHQIGNQLSISGSPSAAGNYTGQIVLTGTSVNQMGNLTTSSSNCTVNVPFSIEADTSLDTDDYSFSIGFPETGWAYGQNGVLIIGQQDSNTVYLPLIATFQNKTKNESTTLASGSYTVSVNSVSGLSNNSNVSIQTSQQYSSITPGPLNPLPPQTNVNYLTINLTSIPDYFGTQPNSGSNPSFVNGVRELSVNLTASYVNSTTSKTFNATQVLDLKLLFLQSGFNGYLNSSTQTPFGNFTGFPTLPVWTTGDSVNTSIPYTGITDKITVTKGDNFPAGLDVSYSNGNIVFSGKTSSSSMTNPSTLVVKVTDGTQTYDLSFVYLITAPTGTGSNGPTTPYEIAAGTPATAQPEIGTESISINSQWSTAAGQYKVVLPDTTKLYIPVTISLYTPVTIKSANPLFSIEYLSKQPSDYGVTKYNPWTGAGYYLIASGTSDQLQSLSDSLNLVFHFTYENPYAYVGNATSAFYGENVNVEVGFIPAPQFDSSGFPSCYVGTPYNETIQSLNHTSFTFVSTTGLPPGITFVTNKAGTSFVATGNATKAGTYDVSAVVMLNGQSAAPITIPFTVLPALPKDTKVVYGGGSNGSNGNGSSGNSGSSSGGNGSGSTGKSTSTPTRNQGTQNSGSDDNAQGNGNTSSDQSPSTGSVGKDSSGKTETGNSTPSTPGNTSSPSGNSSNPQTKNTSDKSTSSDTPTKSSNNSDTGSTGKSSSSNSSNKQETSSNTAPASGSSSTGNTDNSPEKATTGSGSPSGSNTSGTQTGTGKATSSTPAGSSDSSSKSGSSDTGSTTGNKTTPSTGPASSPSSSGTPQSTSSDKGNTSSDQGSSTPSGTSKDSSGSTPTGTTVDNKPTGTGDSASGSSGNTSSSKDSGTQEQGDSSSSSEDSSKTTSGSSSGSTSHKDSSSSPGSSPDKSTSGSDGATSTPSPSKTSSSTGDQSQSTGTQKDSTSGSTGSTPTTPPTKSDSSSNSSTGSTTSKPSDSSGTTPAPTKSGGKENSSGSTSTPTPMKSTSSPVSGSSSSGQSTGSTGDKGSSAPSSSSGTDTTNSSSSSADNKPTTSTGSGSSSTPSPTKTTPTPSAPITQSLSLPEGFVNVGYSQYVSIPLTAGIFTFTKVEGNPAWLTVTQVGSQLYFQGMPSEVTTSPITFQVLGTYTSTSTTDPTVTDATFNCSLTITKKLHVSYTTPITTAPGQSLTLQPTVTNAVGNPTFAFTGTVPTSLQISSLTGIITGSLSQTGSTTLTVSCSDNGQTVQTSIVINVAQPLKVTYPAISGVVGKPVSVSPTVTNGLGTKTFSLSTMSHTSATSPNSSISQYVHQESWETLPQSLPMDNKQTLTYSGLATPFYPVGNEHVPASPISFIITNGTPTTQPISPSTPTASTSAPTSSSTNSSSSTNLIPIPEVNGLSLNTVTGEIVGTPTLAGSTSFQVQCTDQSGSVVTTVNVVIVAALKITGTLPEQGVGNPFSFTPTVTGGNPSQYTFTYKCTYGLPSGIAFNSKTGGLNGTCNTPISNCLITITCTDGSQSASLTITLNVIAGVSLIPNQSPIFSIGTAGTYQLQGSNLTGSLVYSIIEGSLPPGLSLNTTMGVISGIPTAVGSYPVSIQVIGPVNKTTAKIIFTVVDDLSISSTLPVGTIGIPYSFIPTVTGGNKAKYRFTLTVNNNGVLIPGLSFNTSTGAITGTPTATGYIHVTITVTDGQTTASLKDLPLLVQSLVNSSSPQDSQDYIQQLLQEYVTTLTGSTVTDIDRAEAIKLMIKASQALVANPTSDNCELFYEYHTRYQNTLFETDNFFVGQGLLPNSLSLLLSGVYSAFRSLVTTPDLNVSFDYLGAYPINCVPLLNWVIKKRNLILQLQQNEGTTNNGKSST